MPRLLFLLTAEGDRNVGRLADSEHMAYIRAKVGDSAANACSTIGLMRRIGWSAGTSWSGVILHSITRCPAADPRIMHLTPGLRAR